MAHISSEAKSKIQATLDQATQSSQSLPGVVFGAATREGIIFTGASGQRSLDDSTPMDENTIIWIASCTKVITAMAAMQLVEQGKVKLDEPVDSILPEVGKAKVMDSKTGELSPAQSKITLRMLLTHTAGYSYSFFNASIQKWCKEQGGDEFTGQFKYFDQPLVNQPNTKFDYGVNIDWVGVLVERVSGLKLGAYFQKHIFEPVGATDIAFELTDNMRSRLAGMHQRHPDGTLTARKHFPVAYNHENEFHSGGGGLFASISSYLKVISLFLTEGKSSTGHAVLKPDTIQLMLKDNIGKELNSTLDAPVTSVAPDLANTLDNMMPGTEGSKGWGLTFLKIDLPLPTGRSSGSVWWAGLANNFYWIDVEKGVCGMVQAQILPFGDLNVLGAWTAAETEVYKALGKA